MTEEPPTTAAGARRRTGAVFFAAATIISIVGPLLIALVFLRPALAGGSGAGIPLPWTRLAWLAVLCIGISVGPIIGVVVMSRRSARRQARFLALAQAKDGRVCPWCGGDPPMSPDDAPCCRRTFRGWTPEQYQRYWGLVATDEGAATAFLVQTGNITATTSWRWSSVAVLLPFAFIPAISGQTGWMWETAGSLVFLSICAVGASIALGGFWRFSEFAPLCAACRYPRSGSTPRCPECGHDWSARYTGTVMGRRNVARGRVFVGASIAFVGILLFATGRFWMGAVIVRLQSSSTLIESTQATYSFEQRHAWAELQRRTLSPAEQSALFDHLLDSRRGQYTLDLSAKAFMSTYIASGTMTPAQGKRLRRESLDLAVVAPSSARRGESVQVQVEGSASFDFLMPGSYVFVVVTDAWFADEPERHWRTTDRTPHISLMIDRQFGSQRLPPITIDSERAGERELVVRVWLVADVGGLTAITWDRASDSESDTPTFSPTALWSEALELRHRITIEP